MKKKNTTTIVFITGAFISHTIWKNWKLYFEEKGYTVLAPAWPFKDGSPEELRNTQHENSIVTLNLRDIICYYENIIAELSETPIIIGHSLGGLLVQLLLQKNIGIAGVAIHSIPPQGVVSLEWPFIRYTFRLLGFFTAAKKTYLMPFAEWQHAFTNGMPEEQQIAAYYEFVVPESKLVLRDALTKVGKINFKNPHAPLLILSGSSDTMIPASLNYSNYKRYKDKNSVTDYMEFENSNHFVLGLPTWKNEAAFVACWLENNA
ncbi:alpha/beta fold hydrolase [Flavobacterium hauense]